MSSDSANKMKCEFTIIFSVNLSVLPCQEVSITFELCFRVKKLGNSFKLFL